MLPCWRVPPESSAPFPGRRYIGSMVFHKTVMRWAPQLGSTKKRRRDAKGADEDVRILLYFYCFLVLYNFLVNFFFLFRRAHVCEPQKESMKVFKLSFLGGCCTVPLFCVKTNHDTWLLEHLVPGERLVFRMNTSQTSRILWFKPWRVPEKSFGIFKNPVKMKHFQSWGPTDDRF